MPKVFVRIRHHCNVNGLCDQKIQQIARIQKPKHENHVNTPLKTGF